MIPLHHDLWFTFRFADDRIISRFHLEGILAGQSVSVFKIDPNSRERMGLLATAVRFPGRTDVARPKGRSISPNSRSLGSGLATASGARLRRLLLWFSFAEHVADDRSHEPHNGRQLTAAIPNNNEKAANADD
jgi:hypothetical protein